MSTADGKYGIPTRFGKMVKAATGRGADGAAGIGTASASPTPWQDDQFVLAADGAQDLELTFLPVESSPHVALNGIVQQEGVDYTLDGVTLQLLLAADPLTGDVLDVRYQYASDEPTVVPVTEDDYAGEVLADEPALYWRLGEASGAIAYDSSGHGRDGGYVGPLTLGTAGLVTGDTDTCVTFHGSTAERVEIGYGAWMDTTDLTVEALIDTSMSSYGNIIDRDNGFGVREFQFRVTPAGKLQLEIIGSPTVDCTSPGSINDGNRHHAAGTFDGSDLRLYVDGLLVATVPCSTPLAQSGADLRVGINFSAGYVQPFNGAIDEVAFYTTALSGARIAAHAAAAGL